ncbi:MAG: hypothetical protein AVDCRST_MAG22-3686, partial [uncultured Rubrobacteraceae bacterium]
GSPGLPEARRCLPGVRLRERAGLGGGCLPARRGRESLHVRPLPGTLPRV